MARLPFIGPSNSLSPLSAAASECWNLYPEVIEAPDDQQKNRVILRGRPGAHQIMSLGFGSIRGLWSGGGRLFVVQSNTLYEVGIGSYVPGNPSSGSGAVLTTQLLPTPNLTNEPVQIFANASGTMIAIIANGYVHYSLGGAVSKATFATGGDVTALSGAVLGTMLFVNRPWGGSPDLGRQVNYSAPNDYTSWDALDFKDKEGGADYIQRILSDRGQLYVFGAGGGAQSELWQLDESTGAPVRLPGAESSRGCVARWSPVAIGESVFFLGGTPQGQTIAYRVRGLTPQRISTHAVEQSLASIGSFASSATSYGYESNGHVFWVINCPAPVCTWVYDITASDQLGYPVWHQRAPWVSNAFAQSKYWFHTFIPEWGPSGIHVAGGFADGKLYDVSEAYGDDAGTDIHKRRVIPYRYAGGKRLYFGRQDLAAVGGPVTREYSDDQGATWQNATAEMGNGTSRRYWPQGGHTESDRLWRYSALDQQVTTWMDLQGDEWVGQI